MLRICRLSLRWFALAALMAPAAARADLPIAWPVLPAACHARPRRPRPNRRPPRIGCNAAVDPDDEVEPIAGDRGRHRSRPIRSRRFPNAPDSTASTDSRFAGFGRDQPPSVHAHRRLFRAWAIPVAVCSRLSAWKPCFSRRPTIRAAARTTRSPTEPLTTNSYNASSANGMVVTPRLWMGLMGECWGVGVRYWRFADGAGGSTFPTGTNQGLFSQGFLKLQTFDLEAIRRIYYGNSQLWFTVGARYAQLSHGTSISSTDFSAADFIRPRPRRVRASTAPVSPRGSTD